MSGEGCREPTRLAENPSVTYFAVLCSITEDGRAARYATYGKGAVWEKPLWENCQVRNKG